MLPKKPRRQDTNTLIWEYLEGEISPSRAERLAERLEQKAQAREQFVESAVLHGMLFEYFRQQEAKPADENGKRRKRGRSSAA